MKYRELLELPHYDIPDEERSQPFVGFLRDVLGYYKIPETKNLYLWLTRREPNSILFQDLFNEDGTLRVEWVSAVEYINWIEKIKLNPERARAEAQKERTPQ